MTLRGKQKYLGVLISPKFPQDFIVAPHFPCSPHREFPISLPQNSSGQRASTSFVPLTAPAPPKRSLFREAISSPPHVLCPLCPPRPWPTSNPSPTSCGELRPLAAGQIFPQGPLPPSPFFFPQSPAGLGGPTPTASSTTSLSPSPKAHKEG